MVQNPEEDYGTTYEKIKALAKNLQKRCLQRQKR